MSTAVLEAVVCPNPQKRVYRNKKSAARAAVSMTNLFPQQRAQVSYPCACGSHHLTTLGPGRA